MKPTFAICTYNPADGLKNLAAALRTQECLVPYEILAANNNKKHNTLYILEYLAARSGSTLRYVIEAQQDSAPARNLPIEGTLETDTLVFIDDDEMPQPGLLLAARDALIKPRYECYWKRNLSIARAIFRHTMRTHRADASMEPMLGEYLSPTMRKFAQSNSHTPSGD